MKEMKSAKGAITHWLNFELWPKIENKLGKKNITEKKNKGLNNFQIHFKLKGKDFFIHFDLIPFKTYVIKQEGFSMKGFKPESKSYLAIARYIKKEFKES